MDWKTIDSAPKRGWFWLNLDWRGACVGRRSEDRDYDWEFIEHTKPEGSPLFPKYRLNAIKGTATHWMPLPEPPSAGGAK